MLRNVHDLFLDKCQPGSFAGGHLQTRPRALSGLREVGSSGQAGALGVSSVQPFLPGSARKLGRVLFPSRRWKGEAPGEQWVSVEECSSSLCWMTLILHSQAAPAAPAPPRDVRSPQCQGCCWSCPWSCPCLLPAAAWASPPAALKALAQSSQWNPCFSLGAGNSCVF